MMKNTIFNQTGKHFNLKRKNSPVRNNIMAIIVAAENGKNNVPQAKIIKIPASILLPVIDMYSFIHFFLSLLHIK
jgi:hypothetical protein